MTKSYAHDGEHTSISAQSASCEAQSAPTVHDGCAVPMPVRTAHASEHATMAAPREGRRTRLRRARAERRATLRVLRKQRALQRSERRKSRSTPIFIPHHHSIPNASLQQKLSRPTVATKGSKGRAKASPSKAEASQKLSQVPMAYDADLGPISRGIARFASYALTWLRPWEASPSSGGSPLFGFIHSDVVQQIQEAPILGLTQLLPYRAHIAASAKDLAEHPPLILIHGLAGSPGNFAPMRVWLSMHRPRPIHVFDYREYADMFPASEAFGQWLDNLFAQYAPHVQFEILAHSMGGLITRLALLSPERVARIAHVLTLGTPHQGTTLARLGGSTYLRQLQVNSSVFETLRRHENALLPYALTSIWTERDILVLPSAHATLPGYPSYAMHQSTHLSWLLHPRLIDEVFNILDAQRMAMRGLRMHTQPMSPDESASAPLSA